MRVIVTCGPSCEPIDQVRFLSNFSTGELGVLLARAFQECGLEVICLRSRLATYPIDFSMAQVIPFSTNADLARLFERLSQGEPVAAIFHAAALCDYRVEKVITLDEKLLSCGKIPTSAGSLQMTLHPTMKVISKLREWFPGSLLVGWKYEVDGTKQEAMRHAEDQLIKYQLDAIVANGPALENGFEFISTGGTKEYCNSKSALASFLATSLYELIAKK
ncbi:MAG: phosphopantothenoylcysteine decarboxylase [Chthoniobacterales bacterium]